MQKSASDRYKAAGVDVNAGYEAVHRMKSHVARTQIPGVMGGLGGFGGLFAPDLTGLEKPVLVSGADGVGTKLKLAFLLDKHNTVGIDCVAMCVNDILCSGARPLFFLDYIACGKNNPACIEQIVAGVAEGCVQAGCALLGGETAEMPGFYPEDEYDLAGFSVGIVDEKKMISTSNMQAGDVILALPSSGVHSNGFSLIRSVFNMENENSVIYNVFPELNGTLADALLTPTKVYVKTVLELLSQVSVSGICHITGGGFYENIPRMLPPHLAARLCTDSIPPQALFSLIATTGDIPSDEMFHTFNMGVGMCLVVRPEDVSRSLDILRKNGENAFVLGEICSGAQEVFL